jgi:hypothetical protein
MSATMIPHRDLVEIVANSYAGPWTATVAGDVHYVVSPEGEEMVVSLPGSHPKDPIDWFRDFDLWPVWIGGIGYVHAGFGLGAQAAWDAMKPTMPTDKLITFTGYSLGGAMAACLAALYARDFPNGKFRLVTFGAPRVSFLNPWFAHMLSRGIEKTLYAREDDIVPNLPSPLYFAGGPRTNIGSSFGNVSLNHLIANYAIDVKALGL